MKNIFKGLGLGLIALALVVGVGAGSANAALTLGALTVTSDGALTLATTGAFTVPTITLANGETIDNATNGLINATGKLQITGVRLADASDTSNLNEQFLNVTGNITGIGSVAGGKNAKTYLLQVTGTRQVGIDALIGDFDDAAIKASITNKATANAAGYVLRGLDVNATNRDTGSVTNLYGGNISATQKGSSDVVTNLWGLNVKVEADSPNTAPTNVFGLNVEYDMVAPTGTPTLSAGVRVLNNSDIAIAASDPLAGFMVDNGAADRDWQYGLYIDDSTISTADIRLSNGVNVYSGTAVTRAAVQTEVGNDAPIGSLYVGDAAVATTKPNLYVKILDVDDSATNWERVVTQASD